MSAKGKIVRLFSGVALTRGAVAQTEAFGGFHRLLVRTDLQRFAAGTKVQLLLPTDDMRTYTPISTAEGMVLLGWKHAAGGPGARWMANARRGDEVLFVGPQRSLELAAGPVVLVGDETSVAVAAAFAAERPGQVHAVIQSDAGSDVLAAAAAVGLDKVDVVARDDAQATAAAVAARLSTIPNAVVALTGCSQLIVDAREALRRSGVRNIKTKTYWIPGRAGLD